MAYYYKINDSDDTVPPYKGFHLQKVKKCEISGPKINYDFSKHVLIELLDDTTPELELWIELGLVNNKAVIHKRIMIDSHRVKCRRAIVICVNSDEAKQLAQKISQTKVVNRCVCAVVIQDLLSDLCLFEKQVIQCGDNRPQQQLLYVSDLSRSRGPSGLVKFLKEKFSSFGTILSVLVCSDDDDYACPEGVIKFAHLSEAFAAELAFDQYVVGKERLSVTTHHNIILSQCDLRMRLRDAQLHCNKECNEFTQSPFNSCNQTFELNDLDSFDYDCIMDNLEMLDTNHGKHDKSGDSLPPFSDCNFRTNLPQKNTEKNISLGVNKISSERVENRSDTSPVNQSSVHSMTKIKSVEHNDAANTVACINKEMAIYTSETIPFEMSATKIINQENISPHSMKHLNVEKQLHSEKSYENRSDLDSFVTCNDSLDPKFNFFPLSFKKNFVKSFHYDKNNPQSKYLLDCKQFSSSCSDNLNDSDGKSLAKTSEKRRKKFASSQKLCLKSQRMCLSQNSVQTASTKSDILDSELSKLESHIKSTSFCKRNLQLSNSTAEYLNTEPLDFNETSKVTDWLLHLPAVNIENSELSCEKEDSMLIENTFSENNPSKINKKYKNGISISRATLLKSNAPLTSENKILNSNDSLQENEDPNKNLMISSGVSSSIPLVDKSKSPLQAWLKQELVSSTNNSVIKSQETSKSIIVCAARTKDVIISVGCSHMTCDSCYPESTDLLLGYS